jgi:hypothetical protein
MRKVISSAIACAALVWLILKLEAESYAVSDGYSVYYSDQQYRRPQCLWFSSCHYTQGCPRFLFVLV